MISASLSLSLPRLGWKSTSTPRSLKICTAAGESASEMRTLGLVIGYDPSSFPREGSACDGRNGDVSRELDALPLPVLAGRGETRATAYAALGRAALVSAKAQSIHCVRISTSFASTVAPHQMRRPAGASR